MASGGNNAPVKEMMEKAGAKFQGKWDIDNNSKFEEKWDISKNTKFEDNWNVKKNSGSSSQKKNSVLKEILHDVAGKIADKWESHHDEKQKGDGSAAKSGKEHDQKNLDNTDTDSNAAKQETGSVESPSEGGGRDSSSHRTSEIPTRDNPNVQAPVPISQSGLEE